MLKQLCLSNRCEKCVCCAEHDGYEIMIGFSIQTGIEKKSSEIKQIIRCTICFVCIYIIVSREPLWSANYFISAIETINKC